MVKRLLRLEGLAVLLASIFFYWYFDFSWLLFIIFLFVPDLAMLGYMVNNRFGAITYNIFHTYSFPIFLLFVGFLIAYVDLVTLGIIWFAHIGMDRMIGYGLKHPTEFKDTHLNRV